MKLRARLGLAAAGVAGLMAAVSGCVAILGGTDLPPPEADAGDGAASGQRDAPAQDGSDAGDATTMTDGGVSDTATTPDVTPDVTVGDAGMDGSDGGALDAGSETGQEAGPDSGSCPTGAPRQISPLSTSRVTSRQPTLHWVLPSNLTTVTVELCATRACSGTPILSATVTGTSLVATANGGDLTPGVVYWRVYSPTEPCATSPTWQLTVGAGSADGGASSSTSWGTTFDVNGDGYADVVIGADNTPQGGGVGNAYVYLGSSLGTANAPKTTVTGPGGQTDYAGTLASAGDVNGDGYPDLVVGEATGNNAYVYLGGASGLSTTPATTLTGPAGSLYFGASVASAGDVNGDGYADVVVGDFGATSYEGIAYVYLGSASGLSTAPATTIPRPGASGHFGASVASAGDVNGDGYADVLVGASGDPGNAYVYFGSMTGLDTTIFAILPNPAGSSATGTEFGASVATAGDVNGDGYADFVVGAWSGTGLAYLYVGSGSTAGISTSPLVTLTGPDGPGVFFGGSVASAGDMNGDGYADIVVGATGVSSNTGRAYVYFGSPSGLPATPGITLTGPDGMGGQFGSSVASAGDVNGDGYADLVVGAIAVSMSTGTAWVYLGGVSGPDAGTERASPGGLHGNFAASVFGATN